MEGGDCSVMPSSPADTILAYHIRNHSRSFLEGQIVSKSKSRWGLKVRVWVERDGRKVLGPGRVELLEHIAHERSISAAAKKMGMSYRRAWSLVQDMNEAAGVLLVEASTGGPGGGGATVTTHGHEAIRLYQALLTKFAQTTEEAGLPPNPLAADSDSH